MAHSRRKPRFIGLAAPLLALLLVQSAFGFPFRQRVNMSPRVFYHYVGSFVGVVLTGSRHILDDLVLLYEIRQLAMGASQPEKPSVRVSPSSPPPSQKGVCAYRGRFSSTCRC